MIIDMQKDTKIAIVEDDENLRFLVSHRLEKEGYTLEQAVSFGDGFNDVQMLSASGKGLIMGNAPALLKETLPDLEVIKTNSEVIIYPY